MNYGTMYSRVRLLEQSIVFLKVIKIVIKIDWSRNRCKQPQYIIIISNGIWLESFYQDCMRPTWEKNIMQCIEKCLQDISNSKTYGTKTDNQTEPSEMSIFRQYILNVQTNFRYYKIHSASKSPPLYIGTCCSIF